MRSSAWSQKLSFGQNGVPLSVLARASRVPVRTSKAVGMAAACDFLSGLDRAGAETHEAELLAACTDGLESLDGVRLLGTTRNKTAICSFVVDGVHPQDLGSILDQAGVAVRTGHHCTMPAMARFDVPGTVRASMSIYNNLDDIEQLMGALRTAIRMLR